MAETSIRTADAHTARSLCLLLGCALSLALGACREIPRAQLLELERVERTSDDSFVLHGQGFPTDRSAEIELRGRVHRPGHGASAVRVTLSGAAATAQRLEFDIDGHPDLLALSPGQFEGSLAVVFRAGAAEVRGRLPSVRLTLRSGEADARRIALRAARRGGEWLASLGVSELELDLERAGVRAGGVEQGGVAELAGLAPGDRIVALDGSPVADLADLWPAPGAAPVRLRVERGAASRQVEIRLPRAREQRVRAEPRADWLAALLMMGLGLLVLWPVATPSERTPRWGLPWAGAALASVVAAAGWAAQLGGGEIHVLRGALPGALVFLCAPAWAKPAVRVEAWTRAACQVPVACVALACAGLLSGSLSPSIGDPHQGGDWPLLLQPPGWCLLAMVHISLRSDVPGALAQGLTAGARGVMTMALVALLGGAELGLGPGALGSVFSVAGLAWLAFEWLMPRRVFPLVVSGAAALLGPALSLAWFLGARDQEVAATASALAPWLVAALCVRSAWQRLRGRLAPSALDPQLSPFL